MDIAAPHGQLQRDYVSASGNFQEVTVDITSVGLTFRDSDLTIQLQ
jgi:hypothetical protein